MIVISNTPMEQDSNETIYLGIDWGEKRIGTATADNISRIATPGRVVGSLKELLKLAEEEEIDELVIGVPYKMSGTDRKLQPQFQDFLDELQKKAGRPVHMVDERLTSKAADDLEGDKKIKAPRDALAAMLILQQYLDS